MTREALQPRTGWLGLRDDDMLRAELSHRRYEIDSRGRIKIEPTEEIKRRLGRSPDFGTRQR